jgi:hypothetical protein
MKKVLAVVLLSLFATVTLVAQSSSSGSNVVFWKAINGVITAPAVSNPVGGIASGSSPWTTTGGFAFVDLTSGAVTFNVEGLVINGGNASGTPGPVTNVVGALVCNPTASTPTVLETTSVTLSAQGNAQFSGTLASVPSSCTNPVFLIRVPGGPWIATGAVRTP